MRQPSPQGIILAGIVGSGKTTVVEHCLSSLADEFEIFRYTGDDIRFRNAVAEDSRFIYSEVVAATQRRAIVFVDEVQKSESIFDAIKYAFDQARVSFVVSGSNPAFLKTVARKRLQRRGQLLTMSGFSLPEILGHLELVDRDTVAKDFSKILLESTIPAVMNHGISLKPEIAVAGERYLKFGGLPLAHLAADNDVMHQVRAIVDRGFESVHRDNLNLSDVVEVELARIHSREFTYTNIFKKTGERRRDKVNEVILELLNHGYLVVKRPMFPNEMRRSYLCVYSYTDPGIVSYLLGHTSLNEEKGARVEAVVHSRLSLLLSQLPFKNELGYFKPFQVDPSGSTRFLPGEVDFVFQMGKRIIPIEVKSSSQISQIDLTEIRRFIETYKCPYGVVLYGGVPFADPASKIVYWPWWLV